jgi:hypothetical protein
VTDVQKNFGENPTKKRRMTRMVLKEISAVDHPAQAAALVSIIKRHEVDPVDDYEKDLSADQRRHLADTGAALPDGSFYIRNGADLENAIHAWGRANPSDRKKVADHIKARARALGMTDKLPKDGELASMLKDADGDSDSPSSNTAKGGATSMTPEQIAALTASNEQLTKRAERAEKVASLSDAEKAIFAKLEASKQDEFLALTPAGRQAEVQKAAARAADVNPVVETIDGVEYRKNDDPRLIRLAKQSQEDRTARIAAEASVKLEQLTKRAGELKHLPGDESVKVEMLKAIDGLPSELRTKVEAMLKAHDAGLARSFETRGVRGQNDPASPQGQLDTIAKSMREKNPKLTEAQAQVAAMDTPEGRAAYAKMDEERVARMNRA